MGYGPDRKRAEGVKPSALSFGLTLLFAVVSPAGCGAREPTLSYKDGVVRAEGWSGPAPANGWESVLTVRASEDASAPSLLGEYKESGGALIFTPRFPPSPGVKLHAVFHVNQRTFEATFGEPAQALASTTTVAHLYPSTDLWPANTLRTYVEFSAPMSAGDAYTYIRVIGADGRAIEKPFVEVEPELWSPDGKRLTLLFDPGRLKRGLVDNETAGPPLLPGVTVTVEVDAGMRDARGASLAESFRREIHVTDALRSVVDPQRWRVTAPSSVDGDMTIIFDRPLDHALARRAISVTKDGAPVAGQILLEDNETRWRFTPEAAWKPGVYAVKVDGVIEDLAGNRPGKLFDVDTSDPTQSTEARPSTAIGFKVPAR